MKHELVGAGKGCADRSDRTAFKAGFDAIEWQAYIDAPKVVIAPKQAINAPTVLSALKEFVSPIDQTVISDRGQLRRHNKQHGVTNIADYGDKWFERKGRQMHQARQGATKEDKADRIDTIRQTMARMGIRD